MVLACGSLTCGGGLGLGRGAFPCWPPLEGAAVTTAGGRPLLCPRPPFLAPSLPLGTVDERVRPSRDSLSSSALFILSCRSAASEASRALLSHPSIGEPTEPLRVLTPQPSAGPTSPVPLWLPGLVRLLASSQAPPSDDVPPPRLGGGLGLGALVARPRLSAG